MHPNHDSAHGDVGLAIGLWCNGQPLRREFSGLARRDENRPVSEDTVFDIASVSKMFTGLGILMLIEDGLLSRKTRLGDLLPVMKDAAGAVTIDHLLHHCSALPDYMTLFGREGLGTSDRLGMNETLNILSRQPPPDAPARILEPLGMHRTQLVDQMPAQIPEVAYSYDATGYRHRPMWEMTGDGQIHTTLDDLAIWAAELIEARTFRTLVPELLTTGCLKDGTCVPYGVGIRKERIKNRYVYGHGGGWAGFRSSLLVMPSNGLAAIVLANQSDIEAGDMAMRMLTDHETCLTQ